MYAVVRSGGKQYRVEEGRSVRLERLPGEPGDSVELGDVLLMASGEDVTVGSPLVAGARVIGTIAEQGRAKKIVVFRYKAKTRSRKKTGHRQQFTRLIVEDILAAGQEPKPKAEAAPAVEAAVEKPKRGHRRQAAAPAEAAAETAVEARDAESGGTEPQVEEAAPRRRRKKAE